MKRKGDLLNFLIIFYIILIKNIFFGGVRLSSLKNNIINYN